MMFLISSQVLYNHNLQSSNLSQKIYDSTTKIGFIMHDSLNQIKNSSSDKLNSKNRPNFINLTFQIHPNSKVSCFFFKILSTKSLNTYLVDGVSNFFSLFVESQSVIINYFTKDT